MGQQGNGGGLGTYETVQHFNDIKEHLHVVKRNIEHIIQKNAVRSLNGFPEILMILSSIEIQTNYKHVTNLELDNWLDVLREISVCLC